MNIGDSSWFYLNLFCLWLASGILFQFMLKKSSKNVNLNLPPSPPGLPLIGHLHLFSPFLTKCFPKISSKYGPLLYLRLGSRPIVLISSAEFAAEIYRTNDVTFSEKPKTPFGDSLLFGNSSFMAAPYGEYWRFMKKLCMTELLGTKQVERSKGVRLEEVMVFLERLVEMAKKNESVELGKELTKLANNTICRMVMSTRCSKEDDEAEKWRILVVKSIDLAAKMVLATMLGPFKRFGFWLNRKQTVDVPREYDLLFDKILEEHQARAKNVHKDEHDNNKDLVDILLKVYHDQNAEFKLSMGQIKSFLLDLFFAGTDSSGNTMEWIMAELMNHPEVMNKLREEIKTVVGTKRLVEESDIPNLHYLQAVVKESMRLHALGAAIPRECRFDCKIRGYDIPKGTNIIINAYSVMRDPKIWDHPAEFYPERFLQEEDQENQERNLMSFIPFGGGRRKCPGSHFALSIIHITVASMVQCFDWKRFSNDNQENEKLNMDERHGFIASMANPLKCVPVLLLDPNFTT
ncbi:cytochrome P450 family 705 subfamily A polypeptide 22 [Euphorbia peplus]|nr:cytochrome P450 family 705 subfamily A polypeptide 22 [Euphorbia peplus]